MFASPKVSVLISCYNHEKYIHQTIKSVLEQTYTDIELIVIDDGSKDRSFEIIKELADQYGFYAEQQANMGLSKTLNKMLAMASGKYVCIFGSDDIMLPDKTKKQVAFMEANPTVAISGGNALLIDSDGNAISKRQKSYPYREISFECLFTEKCPTITASTCMIKKEVLDKEGGWDPDIPLEDMYMWFKLTSRGYRMVSLKENFVHYRKHDFNTYKNVHYMYESMSKTILPYYDNPLYQSVRLNHLRRYFLKASKVDRSLAFEILRQIPLKAYNKKVLRGCWYLLLPR